MKKKMKKAVSRKSPAKKVATKGKASAAKKKPAPIPAGYHTVTPYLVCRGASDAIAFYKKAFGAKEMLRMPMPDGKLAHAESTNWRFCGHARRRISTDGCDRAADDRRHGRPRLSLRERRRQGIRPGDRRRRDHRDAPDGHVLGRSVRQTRRSIRTQMVDGHAHRRCVTERNGAARRRSDGPAPAAGLTGARSNCHSVI